MSKLVASHPECSFCGETHEAVRTEAECALTTSRTTYGHWLNIEQAIAKARAALQSAEKELAALDVLGDADLSDELAQFRAAWDGAVSNLVVADAFTALIVRLTGQASEHANVAVRRERAVEMAKAEAARTASECGGCRREDVSIAGAVTRGSGNVVALCGPCLEAATSEAARG